MTAIKTCASCRLAFDLGQFATDRSRGDGLHPWCRACKTRRRDVNKRRACGRRYESKNREKMAAYRKTWEKEHRVERSRRMLERLHANEGMRDAAKARRLADPSRSRLYSKAWRSRNPDAVRTMTRRRRAMLAGVESETYAARQIFDRDRWTCAICASAVDALLVWPHPMSASIDHIIPLSRGGPDTVDNVQTAHYSCNSRKGASMPQEVCHR